NALLWRGRALLIRGANQIVELFRQVDDLQKIDRLEQKPIGAQSQGLLPGPRQGVASEDYHGQLFELRGRADKLEDLQSAARRHNDVKEDKVRPANGHVFALFEKRFEI